MDYLRSECEQCYQDHFSFLSNLDNGFSDQYNANKEGACEAGFSAALSQDGLTVLMGAPGRYLLNGELYINHMRF